MAQNLVLNQGESLLIPIVLLDASNTPIDVSPNATINVSASLKVNATVVAEYAVTPSQGQGTISMGTAVNELFIQIDRAQSLTFPIGILRVYLLVEFIDTDFATGVRHEEIEIPYIRVQKGNTENL